MTPHGPEILRRYGSVRETGTTSSFDLAADDEISLIVVIDASLRAFCVGAVNYTKFGENTEFISSIWAELYPKQHAVSVAVTLLAGVLLIATYNYEMPLTHSLTATLFLCTLVLLVVFGCMFIAVSQLNSPNLPAARMRLKEVIGKLSD